MPTTDVCTSSGWFGLTLFDACPTAKTAEFRDWDAAANRYTVKQQDFGFAPAEARKVRPNASLISTAAQYGVPLAARMEKRIQVLPSDPCLEAMLLRALGKTPVDPND